MAGWDYFISHASEDKELIAAPLAHVLEDANFKVWYDDLALRAGDSLSLAIHKGLRDATYGIVILSPHFFAKRWPMYELATLTEREVGPLRVLRPKQARKRIILPVWYDVTLADIERHAPNLVDLKGVTTDRGLQAVAEQIVQATHPERLADLPLTNVHDESDHRQMQDAFRTLLDRNPPLRDIRLFLSAYHSLLKSIVGYHPILIPAYKLECPVPFDFVLLAPQGATGGMQVQLIALGPVEGTAAIPQMLEDIRSTLGPRLATDDDTARGFDAVNYAPLRTAFQHIRSILSASTPSNDIVRMLEESWYWERPQDWRCDFLVIAGRRRTEGIDKERAALRKLVDFPVEFASYDRLLD